MKKPHIPAKYQVWIDARKRFMLTHAQIQMARELGLNPKKFGGLANHKQEPWKAPLGKFIERIYEKCFHKPAPDIVRSIEDLVKAKRQKKELRKQDMAVARESSPAPVETDELQEWRERLLERIDAGTEQLRSGDYVEYDAEGLRQYFEDVKENAE